MRVPPTLRWILLATSYALVAALAVHLTLQWVPGQSTPLRSDFPRRLAAEERDSLNEYRFFYATNRPPMSDLIGDAAAERSDSLSFGTFQASVSPRIAVQPSVWLDREFLRVLEPNNAAPAAFFREMKGEMERSPDRSVLVVVWGWKERWATAAAKTAYLAYMLDIDTPVAMFDWPANQGTNARGYLAAREAAHASAGDLGSFLAGIIEHVRPDNLWLVAMSMGSQLACDSLDHLVVAPGLGDAEKEIAHVVLVAPDVATGEFDAKFAAQVSSLSRYLTVYVSSTDQALLLSQWLNRRSRLGRVEKARPQDPGEVQFAHAGRLLALESAGSREIDVVDVTPINRHRNRHNFLTDDPEFLDELYSRLLGPGQATSRRLYPVRSDAGAVYWILWDQ